MDFSRLYEVIRFWGPIAGLMVVAWNGYDYFQNFQTGADSPLKAKRAELDTVRLQNAALTRKGAELDAFVKRLEEKKIEITGLSQKLAEMRGALSDDVSMPDFMGLLVSEAKRVGLSVQSMVPGRRQAREYYSEYPVELKFRGVYAQAFTFLQRLSNLQRIVRVDRFDMRPTSHNATGRYVEIEGTIEVKTFSYLGSSADKVGKEAGK